MAVDDYNPGSSLAAYFPSRDERRVARLWAREKTLHDLADLGAVDFFEGGGSDPTVLPGYAADKLWLRVDPGVTDAPGTVRYYGGGDATLLASWPELDRAGFATHVLATQPRLTREEIKAIDTTHVTLSYCVEDGREGLFVWTDGNFSSNVAIDTAEGCFIKANLIDASVGAWVRIYDGPIKVSWFGAVGDGVVDDTIACQAALDYVAATYPFGARVLFPAGRYRLTDTLVISSSGVVLYGESALGSYLTWDNPTCDQIYMYGSSAPGIYNVEVRDIEIETMSTRTAGAAIRMYRVNSSRIDNVTINQPFDVFDCKTVNNVTISNSRVGDIRGSFGVKFWSLADGTERSDVLTVRDTSFDFNNHGGSGILWDGFAHTLRLERVTVLDALRGIHILNSAGSPYYYPAFGEWTSVEIDGVEQSAVRIEAGSGIRATACNFLALSTSTEPVVDVFADDGGSYTNAITINGGRVFGGGAEAVSIGGRNVIVTGNHIGGGSNTGVPCVKILDGAQDFLITGNSIGVSWGSHAYKYTHGVDVAANTYRGLIDNNSYYACLGEVLNACITGTVSVGSYLNRNGIPNDPPTILRRSDDNSGSFEDTLYNTSVGPNVTAMRKLVTGTPGAVVHDALKDNNGAPYHHVIGNSVVTQRYVDFDQQYFRTSGGSPIAEFRSSGGDRTCAVGDVYPVTLYSNDGSGDPAVFWKGGGGGLRFGTTTNGKGAGGFVELLRIMGSGKVGIGTTTPEAKLHVQDTATYNPQVRAEHVGETANSAAYFLYDRARGTPSARTSVQNGDVLGRHMARGYDGVRYIDSAFIAFRADGAVSTGIVPASIDFITMSSAGSTTTRLTVDADGYVGIGGVISPSANLHTSGTVRFASIVSGLLKVDASGNVSAETAASASEIRVGTATKYVNVANAYSAVDLVTLTDAATISVDMSTFINATVTLAGNRTLGSPTNEKVGQSGVIYIVQDATGSRTLAYGSDWKFAGGTAPTLTTTANAVDALFYTVRANNFIVANLIKDVK